MIECRRCIEAIASVVAECVCANAQCLLLRQLFESQVALAHLLRPRCLSLVCPFFFFSFSSSSKTFLALFSINLCTSLHLGVDRKQPDDRILRTVSRRVIDTVQGKRLALWQRLGLYPIGKQKVILTLQN